MGVDGQYRELVMQPFDVALADASLVLVGVPALSDNYVWLLHSRPSDMTLVVDPGEAEPVRQALAARGWSADHIWITHWHPDHVGGIAGLRDAFPDVSVIGPAAEAARIGELDDQVEPGETVSFDEHDAAVIATPGHTAGHIAFHLPGPGLLFSGDTLFAMGCGRLFEGTAADMHQSLSRLAALPDETMVLAAHEYTLSNARFSVAQAPGDEAIARRLKVVEALRQDDRPTLPTTLGDERATNLFLRAPDVAAFAALRLAKDRA